MKASNSFSVAGRLAADAQVKNTTNSNVANARVAVSSKKGENTTTGWIDIEAWNKDAQAFENLKKGQLIQFNGFLRPEEYKTKDGKHRQVIIFVATSWEPVTADTNEEKGE